MKRNRFAVIVALFGVFSLSAGCGSTPIPTQPGLPAASISVSPDNLSLNVGDTGNFTVATTKSFSCTSDAGAVNLTGMSGSLIVNASGSHYVKCTTVPDASTSAGIATLNLTVNVPPPPMLDLPNITYVRPSDRPLNPTLGNLPAMDINVEINYGKPGDKTLNCSVVGHLTWNASTSTLICDKISGVPSGVLIRIWAADPAIIDPTKTASAIIGHDIYTKPGQRISQFMTDGPTYGSEYGLVTFDSQGNIK
jgi:hypothetical protein